MPHVKPRICQRCGKSYTGWKCPCRNKGKSSASRSKSIGMSFSVGRILNSAVYTAAPVAAPAAHIAPKTCWVCGTVTSEHYCPHCNSDVWRFGK